MVGNVDKSTQGGGMPNNPVLRGEYTTFKDDVERRLNGHDSMYRDVSELQSAIHELTSVFRRATEDVQEIMGDSRDPNGKCAKCRTAIDDKIDDINKWRWRVIGAFGAFIAIPTVVSCIILIKQLSVGGLK
jgi:t-SNARE complex subunit (syntaxin)